MRGEGANGRLIDRISLPATLVRCCTYRVPDDFMSLWRQPSPATEAVFCAAGLACRARMTAMSTAVVGSR